MTLQSLLQEMELFGALPAYRAVPPNSSHSAGMVHVDKTQTGQDREGLLGREDQVLAPNATSFPPEPPGASSSIIPVYCALLAAVVLGLLSYVVFKCWRSHKHKQKLDKARTAELGSQMHGESNIFLDTPSTLDPCSPSQGF